jgi:3-methyladenine DNA glycosylase AlkD
MSTTTDVARITAYLKEHGSAKHAAGVQWFFKETIRSYGWRAADLRRYARAINLELAADPPRLLDVAERLFHSQVIDEKAMAVLILQRSLRGFGPQEFRRFERWLALVSSWADHDALAMCLIGPMMTADARRTKRVYTWAASRRRWHRRAAAVSLIDGVRHGLFTHEATDITFGLIADTDDMVRKGLGWLLREWGKVRPGETIPLLLSVRAGMSRLVLRTACERLPATARAEILARPDGR